MKKNKLILGLIFSLSLGINLLNPVISSTTISNSSVKFAGKEDGDKSTTYTFDSKSWGDSSSSWNSNKDGNQLTKDQGVQITIGTSEAGATTKAAISNISQIDVMYCTNAAKGEGSISVSIGTKDFSKFDVSKPSSGGTTLKTASFYDGNNLYSGQITISVSCTQNSIYIYSVTAYTRDTSSELTPEEKIAGISTKAKLNYNYDKKVISGKETINFSELGYSNEQSITSIEANNYSIVFSKENGSNAPKYYTNGTAIRAYAKNTFSVSSEFTLTSITIDFGTGDGSNTITTNTGTYNNGTWTGKADSVTFTIGGNSGQRRIAGLNVNFEETKFTFSDVNLNFGAIVTKENYNTIFDGASTKKIGVAFARTSNLKTDNNNTVKQALTEGNATYIGKTEVDPAVTSPFTTDENGVLDVNGTHYSWSVTLAVPTLDAESKYTEAFLTESITAVAYMYADNHYVFFGEREMSVAQAAEAYKSHSVYSSGTDMTRATLDYLAALDD